MNKNRRLKKGFTLVELVVVIAVIAILAAVSVGAYFGITESANRSADEQAVTQLNKMLETYEILTGRVDNVEEAKDIFEDNGVTNYTPFFDKNTFYWTHADSRVIIWTEGKGVTFPSWAAENYKSYSETKIPSKDWYDLNTNVNKVPVTPDDEGHIDGSQINTEILNAQEDIKLVVKENSTIDMGGGLLLQTNSYFANNAKIETLEIDLNGSTINNTTPYSNGNVYSFVIPQDKTLIVSNGTIYTEIKNDDDYINAFTTYNGSRLILRNMTIIFERTIIDENSNINPSSGVYAMGSSTEIVLEGCTIKGFEYGIGTNARDSIEPSYYIKNCTIDAMLCVFINVPGKATINNSKLFATWGAIVARSGSIIARNSYLYTEECEPVHPAYYSKYSTQYGTYYDGNYFPVSVAMLGNYSSPDSDSYKGDVNARFENCEFDANNPYDVMTVPKLLVAADNNTNVAVTYTNCNIESSSIVQYDAQKKKLAQNDGTIEINGTVYNYTDNKYNG